jgi:hypothetical protein
MSGARWSPLVLGCKWAHCTCPWWHTHMPDWRNNNWYGEESKYSEKIYSYATLTITNALRLKMEPPVRTQWLATQAMAWLERQIRKNVKGHHRSCPGTGTISGRKDWWRTKPFTSDSEALWWELGMGTHKHKHKPDHNIWSSRLSKRSYHKILPHQNFMSISRFHAWAIRAMLYECYSPCSCRQRNLPRSLRPRTWNEWQRSLHAEAPVRHPPCPRPSDTGVEACIMCHQPEFSACNAPPYS